MQEVARLIDEQDRRFLGIPSPSAAAPGPRQTRSKGPVEDEPWTWANPFAKKKKK